MTREGTDEYFFDRDASHFKFVLNYLRDDATCDLRTLPHDIRYLHELMMEAKYYRLPGLQRIIRTKVTQLTGTSINV